MTFWPAEVSWPFDQQKFHNLLTSRSFITFWPGWCDAISKSAISLVPLSQWHRWISLAMSFTPQFLTPWCHSTTKPWPLRHHKTRLSSAVTYGCIYWDNHITLLYLINIKFKNVWFFKGYIVYSAVLKRPRNQDFRTFETNISTKSKLQMKMLKCANQGPS